MHRFLTNFSSRSVLWKGFVHFIYMCAVRMHGLYSRLIDAKYSASSIVFCATGSQNQLLLIEVILTIFLHKLSTSQMSFHSLFKRSNILEEGRSLRKFFTCISEKKFCQGGMWCLNSFLHLTSMYQLGIFQNTTPITSCPLSCSTASAAACILVLALSIYLEIFCNCPSH